jgi:YD repeat-containing protein
LGAVSIYELNERLQVVAETDALGATTRHEWDQGYRLLSSTDPLGRTTTHEYNAAGLPITVTRADGSQSKTSYDELGRVTSWTDFDGSTRSREFDTDGRILAEVDADGEVVRFERAGRHERETAIEVGPTVMLRNAAQQITSMSRGGAETHYEYDYLGRVVAVRNDAGTTRAGWTPEGELAWRENPDGGLEEFVYDGEGNLIETVDAAGRLTVLEYGMFDLVSAQIDDDDNRTDYAYDTELRLIAVTDPVGETTRYAYDGNGRLVEECDFEGRIQRYGYDAAGQLIEYINAAGDVTHYIYDLVGNRVERRSGDAVTRFTYDPAGRVLTATDADSQIRLERDALGRVVSETVNGYTVATSYSDRFGVVTARTRPSGAVTRWSYDESGRPSVLAAGGHHLQFAYDGAREVSRAWDAGAAITPGSRLEQTPGQTPGGQTLGGQTLGGQTLGGQGEPGDARYTLDILGRPVTRSDTAGDWQLTWDHEDRLVTVGTPSGDHWHYRYDAFGRRITKQRRDATGVVLEEISFIWSGNLLVEQHHRDHSGTVSTTVWEYHPEVAHPVAQVIDNDVQAVVTDETGIPVDVAGIDGILTGNLNTIALRSAGRYLDTETGLQYDNSRYYDPATNRHLPQPRTTTPANHLTRSSNLP